MAEFNPQTQEFEAAEGNRRLQGTRSAGTLGTALEGIGGVIDAAVGITDSVIKSGIDKEVQKEVDLLNAELGVEAAATVFGSGPDQTVPSEIARGERELAQLALAAQHGEILPRTFNARALNIVRQLKARHPGYRDYVDEQLISRLYGNTPANQLRNQLMEIAQQEGDAARRASLEATKTVEDMLWWMTSNGIPAPPAGMEQSPAALRAWISTFTVAERELDLAEQQLRINQAGDEANVNQTRIDVTNAAFAMFDQMALGQLANTQRLYTYALSGGTISAEQAATILSDFLTIKSTFLSEFNQRFQDALVTLPTADQERVLGDVNRRFDTIEKMLRDGDFGLAMAELTFSRIEDSTRRREMIEGAPILGVVSTLKEVMGEQYLAQWMSTEGGLLTTLNTQTARVVGRMMKELGVDPGQPVSELIDTLRTTFGEAAIGEPIGKHIGASLVSIRNKDLTPEQAENFFKILLDPNIFAEGYITEASDRREILRGLTHPDVLANLERLGNSEITTNYQQFIINQAAIVYGSDIRALLDDKVTMRTPDGRTQELDMIVTLDNGYLLPINDAGLINSILSSPRAPGAATGDVVSRQDFTTAQTQAETVNGWLRQITTALISAGMSEEEAAAVRKYVVTNDTSALEAVKFPEEDKEPEKAGDPAVSIKDVVSRAEGTGENYNAIFGRGDQTQIQLTGMTISEVRELQRTLPANERAVGRWQIVPDTLDDLVRQMGLTGDELFDEETQDKMFEWFLYNRADYQAYLDGDITKQRLANNLANIWAGLPIVSGADRGKSRYHGVGRNRATISVDDFLAALPDRV